MPSSFILIVGFCCFLIVQALPNVMHLFSPNELSSFKAKVVHIDRSIGSYNGERVSGCDKKLTVNSKDYGRVQLCAIKVSLLKLFRKGDTVVIEGKKSFWGFSISGWSFDKKILERAANQ
jgi:hypothetical protein